MPMKVYMDANDYHILPPDENDEYPKWTIVLKVGNGANVFARFSLQRFKEFAESIEETRKWRDEKRVE
ncbi:MAG: hypothetical protein ACTSPB_02345 [Candidatus Thorarchaeota archaeon]